MSSVSQIIRRKMNLVMMECSHCHTVENPKHMKSPNHGCPKCARASWILIREKPVA